MVWTSSNDGSDPAALMHPLLRGQSSSDDAQDGTQSLEADGAPSSASAAAHDGARSPLPPPPPPPISGNVPSPTSGIHTILQGGVNHTIQTHTSDAQHQLRHRQVHHVPLQHSKSTPRQKNDNIHQSHSMDDADVAAGARELALPTTRGRARATANNPYTSPRVQVQKGVWSEPKSRSFSHPLNLTERSSSMGSGGSRSLGNTPVKPYFHNGPTDIDDTNSYQQHSTNFFQQMQQQSHDDGLPPPPHAQRMERGMRVGAAYGGSEHDFLLLSAASSVQDEEGSCSSAASSQGDATNNNNNSNRMSRRKGRSYYSPKRGTMPSLPPLEITTGRALSYPPPYGLPSIEGSPSMAADRGRKAGMMLLNSANNVDNGIPEPPFRPLAEEAEAKCKFVVLGWDLSSYTRRSQFLISAGGTFGFSLLYGYLQELISVELCHRKLGLFLALAQFTGYTILSYFFRRLERGVNLKAAAAAVGSVSTSVGVGVSSSSVANDMSFSRRLRRLRNWGRLRGKVSEQSTSSHISTVPLELYIGLSILRAIDLGMTNLAMQYVNYPAKTLMKSTRVVFTMIFGVIVTKKRYGAADFGIVGLMVAGLGMFMHADAKTSAVFQPLGIIMLTISLLCDGAISNLSEALMNQYEVGQDEFIFRLYSIATFFIFIAAAVKGDLRDGMVYLTQPGTLQEIEEDLDTTWSVSGKVLTMALFSTTGFLGSSCSAAITKSFGALTMSITSTARKATTIFLSFALFPNECTLEHIGGIFLFIASLVAKSLRASKRSGRHHHRHSNHHQHKHIQKGGSQVVPLMEMTNCGGTTANLDASNNTSVICSPLQCSPLHLRRKALAEDSV